MANRKKILLPYGAGNRIAEEFGANRATVSSALNFVTNSYLSREIRRRAMELGGTVVELGAGGVGRPAEDMKE